MMTRAFFIALCLAATLHCQQVAAESEVAIEWNPAESANPVWLGYLVSRALFHEKHKLPVPASGEVIPTFAEEVTARLDALQIYEELKAKHQTPRDEYWEDVSKVVAKNFVRAYVWSYFRRSTWSASGKPRDLADFERWRTSALKKHHAETHGRLSANRK